MAALGRILVMKWYHPQLASILIMNTQALNRLEIGMNYWQLPNGPLFFVWFRYRSLDIIYPILLISN